MTDDEKLREVQEALGLPPVTKKQVDDFFERNIEEIKAALLLLQGKAKP